MILKNVSVEKLGLIDRLSQDFTDGLNLIKCRESDLLFDVIRLILLHKTNPPLHIPWGGAEARIEASVQVKEKVYLITVSPNTAYQSPNLIAYDADGNDVTSEYCYLSNHCFEQDRSEVFDGAEKSVPWRILQYANEDLYYAPHELSAHTDGFSDLKAFRAYLQAFIRNFNPETVREGKQYEIVLGKDGRYGIRHKTDGDLPAALSASERTLFCYLCFLRTAEFWHGFEELRNLNGIQKPLLIKDFQNRLDEAINITPLLQRTVELKRQVIMLS